MLLINQRNLILLLGTICMDGTNAFTAPVPSRTTAIGTHYATKVSSMTPTSFARYAQSNPSTHNDDEVPPVVQRVSTQPKPVLLQAVQHFMGEDISFTKAASTAAVAAAFAVLLAISPLEADAAMSGGRMGGSFRAPSSSSSTRMISPSRSYYGGGGGYSYYSRPSIIAAPIIIPSPIAPIVPYYGYGGAGVISYSRGPSFFDLLFLGGIGFFIFNMIRSSSSTIASDSILPWTDTTTSTTLGNGASVVQLSVALNVPHRDDRNSILSVLDRLAQTAQTDSRVGVQQLTSQVALELLRRKSSISAGYSKFEHFNDYNQAQRNYNSVSVKERSKFEKELVSKYGGVDYQSSSSSRGSASSDSNSATLAVVTIVLAIAGDSTKVPRIRSVRDVEDALQKIASDVKVDDCLLSAEILWTPEDRSETLSYRDIIADYPELSSV